jgi:hypothetical protein
VKARGVLLFLAALLIVGAAPVTAASELGATPGPHQVTVSAGASRRKAPTISGRPTITRAAGIAHAGDRRTGPGPKLRAVAVAGLPFAARVLAARLRTARDARTPEPATTSRPGRSPPSLV